MCTAIRVQSKNTLFGRNMDIDESFGEQVILVPRNYEIKFKNNQTFYRHYAIMGIGTIIDNYPLLADAFNEKGLGFAGLSFKDNAKYFDIDNQKDNYAPYELPLYLLATSSSVSEVVEKIQYINVSNVPFSKSVLLTDLHFIFVDKKESIVIETTINGINIYKNPYDVLTNNPPFSYHVQNISNYQNLHNGFLTNKLTKNTKIKNYSYGQGAMGLPGDFSSASRFIRALYIKNNMELLDTDKDIVTFFKCLNNVAMIKGTIKTEKGYEYTRYTNCYNLDKMLLYYQTYDSLQINSICFDKQLYNEQKIISYKL